MILVLIMHTFPTLHYIITSILPIPPCITIAAIATVVEGSRNNLVALHFHVRHISTFSWTELLGCTYYCAIAVPVLVDTLRGEGKRLGDPTREQLHMGEGRRLPVIGLVKSMRTSSLFLCFIALLD